MECLPKTELKELKRRWDAEGVVCVRNAFDDHANMLVAAQNTPVFEDARVPSRKSHCLDEAHPIAKGVYGDDGVNRLYEHLHGYKMVGRHFPVEYRVYPENSTGMRPHRDLQMFDTPQTEMVYTTHNDSTSTFYWHDSSETKHTIRPHGNDLVLVRASGPVHGVTNVEGGTRGIVKFVGHAPDATPTGSLVEQKAHCPTGH
jgi:hypothetical protein